MLGDVGQPGPVRAVGGELAVDQVIVDRRPGLAGQAAAVLLNTDQIRCWEHSRATRFSPAVMPRPGSSSAMNRYPNAGSSAWMSQGGVDQVRIVPVPLRDRFWRQA